MTAGRRGKVDPGSEAEFLKSELAGAVHAAVPAGAAPCAAATTSDDVDEFVDRVVAIPGRAGRGLTVEDVRTAPFRPRRGGYREDAVDETLDRVVEHLLLVRRQRRTRAADAACPAATPRTGARADPGASTPAPGEDAPHGRLPGGLSTQHRGPGRLLGGRRPGHPAERTRRRRRSSTRPRAPFYRWFPDGVLNTCDNALDRHVGGRARRTGSPWSTTARSPAPSAPTPTPQLLDEVARVRRRAAPRSVSARATGSSSTCRWCPRPWSRCSPARGSAPCTRWCSAGSPRTSWPPGSMTPSRGSWSRPPAASR